MAAPCPDRLREPCAVALAVFTVSLIVYTATAARTICWGDSAEFVTVASTLGIAHPPGYPLYTLLGALVEKLPVGAPFFRMSLLSALFAAAAAATAALTVWAATSRPVTPRWPPVPNRSPEGRSTARRGAAAAGVGSLPRVAGALLTGLGLAFGPTFWSQAVAPEVYSLSAFLSLSALFLFTVWRHYAGSADPVVGVDPEVAAGLPSVLRRDRPVVLLGLVVGLALANHLAAIFIAAPLAAGLFGARRRPSLGPVFASLCLLALGLSLYAYLPLRAAHDPVMLWAPVGTWNALVAHVTGEQYAPLLFATPMVEVGHKLKEFAAGLPSEMTWPGLVLALSGLVFLMRRARAVGWVVVAWCALVTGHAAVYRIPDIASYYTPVYCGLAVAAGVGLASLVGGWRSIPVVNSARVRRAAPAVGRAAIVLALALPAFLAASGWKANDLSGATGCRGYLRAMLDSIEPGGVVVSMTDNVLFPLWYAQRVEGLRTDVAVIAARERAPHLEHLYPDLRFPSEDELCSAFESGPADGGSALAEIPVGNYLPLFFSMNAGERPLYTDAELALRLFVDRSIPRGILVEIAPAPFDSLPEEERAAHDRFWKRVLRRAGRADGLDRRTTEVYAVTLAEHGSLMLEKGETAWAVDALERACALAPDVPLCHSNLGVAYERSGRRDAALDEFEVAIELNPGLASPHHNIAVASRRSGELGRAVEEMEIAVALEPDNPYYRMEYGGLLEELSEYELAEEMYRSAALLSKDEWGASLAYGDFLRRMRRYSEAVAAYQRAEELRPGSEGALKGLGRCYWALDDREQALEVATRLAELQPNNPAPRFDLAVMLHRSGRDQEAIRYLDDVIRILPNMWEARALKASILGEMGRYWEARALFEDALECGARGPAFWDTWISMESALGDNGIEDEVRARAEASADSQAARDPGSRKGEDPAGPAAVAR